MSSLYDLCPERFRSPTALAGLPPTAPVAVALSGGADSVALLHLLSRTHAGPLRALHVHHGIRGAEADRDAAFCEALATQLGVPFTCLRVDVPARCRESGEGLESAARAMRYEAFDTFLTQNALPILATAHHADDQLETLLQNLLRGAGLRGLCGIPACRPLGGGTVVRPLLLISKAEILEYCERHGLRFVSDSTNAEPCCPRNRLRLEVLPTLRDLWPAGAVRAAHCADALREDEAYLTGQAEEFLAREGQNPLLSALAALPRPIFARVLRALLPKAPEAVHIEALWRLVAQARPHAALSLPGATATVRGGRLLVRTDPEEMAERYEIALAPGKTLFPSGVAILTPANEESPDPRGNDYHYAARLLLSQKALASAPVLRPRQAGDRILSGGHHKAVRRLACMAPFSPAERARMPLVCDTEGVLAVPFGPVRDGAGGDELCLWLYFN